MTGSILPRPLNALASYRFCVVRTPTYFDDATLSAPPPLLLLYLNPNRYMHTKIKFQCLSDLQLDNSMWDY
jgi:hypothetical protein